MFDETIGSFGIFLAFAWSVWGRKEESEWLQWPHIRGPSCRWLVAAFFLTMPFAIMSPLLERRTRLPREARQHMPRRHLQVSSCTWWANARRLPRSCTHTSQSAPLQQSLSSSSLWTSLQARHCHPEPTYLTCESWLLANTVWAFSIVALWRE